LFASVKTARTIFSASPNHFDVNSDMEISARIEKQSLALDVEEGATPFPNKKHSRTENRTTRCERKNDAISPY